MIKKLLDRTFWKFILVGIINTIVGTGVMFLCYNAFHLNYWVSSAMNYIIGSIVSYFLNKYFTFQNKQRSWKIVIKFIINISVCYLIAYGVAKPLVARILSGQSVTIQENGAMLVGMCLFVGLNYLGQRFFAFKKEET
ncbi:Putative flippase GtrA (transmembrane translocase of bactoprenol-linked glucose) [Sharpea azabuensis]|uniref:GtrA family protein n=1 Tax=Sharpea azabuensis TaxID=322505 RepID=UPI0008E8FF29|nr:GtrA family protein [Sharpea azabuensis]SFE48349.1 Putative flippase GtrA (transmembrane translocase of bactoprenol-linked glucose) [Sharpea azabuensis]SFL22734.1 Putative flippase GtrA (transmembrane translocase of bactoprenol-linked glucose) [Sharpea azabuensis]